MSTNTIATLAVEMVAKLDRLQADMDQAKRVVSDNMKGIEQAVGLAKTAFVAFAGIASIDAFVSMIKGSIEATAKLHDLAAQTGASVEALSAMRSVGKATGTDIETIAGAMNKLAKNMAGATEDTKGTGKALEALGIDFETFKSLSPDEQMQAVAKAMDEFADGSGKSAVAMALYGKEGAKLIPYLKELTAAGELHAKVTTAQAEQAHAFEKNLILLQASGDGWKKELAMGMLPALNDASKAFLDVMNGAGGLRDAMRDLSDDGSLSDWTRAGITVLTYFIDVLEAVWRVVQRLYLETKADFTQLQDVFKGFGKALDEIGKGNFKDAISEISKGFETAEFTAIKAQVDIDQAWSKTLLGESIRIKMDALKDLGATAEAAKPQVDFTNVMSKNKDAADKTVKAYADLVASIREKIAATNLETESGGKLTEAQKQQLEINKQVEKGTISLKDATSDKTKALLAELAASENAKAVQEDLRKINEEVWKDYLKHTDALQKNAQAIEDKVRKQIEENDAIGKTKAELLQLEIARLRDEAATLGQVVQQEEYLGLCTRETVAHQDTLAALQKLIDAKEQGVHLQAAKEAADAWEKTAKIIETSLTDALMRGFEAGKSFGQNLKDSLINLFKTLILRPIIQPIAQGASSAVLGLLGMGGSGNASAGTGTFSDALSISGLGDKAYSLYQGGVNGLAGMYGSVTNSAIGQQLGLSSLVDNGVGGFAVEQSALGAALGPIALGVAAVYAIVKSLDNSGTPHTGGVGSYSAASGSLTGGAADAFVQFDPGKSNSDWVKAANDGAANISKGIVGMLDSLSGTFGKTTGYSAGTGYQDDSSKDGAWGALKIALGGKTLLDWGKGQDKWPGREFSDGQQGVQEYNAALAADVRTVLDGIGLPNWATKMLNDIGNSPTLEQLDAAVQYIVKFQNTVVGLNSFGGAFSNFATASDDARAAIVGLVGGLDALVQKASSFVTNYYSQNEQGGMTAKLIEQGLAAAGFTADQINALSSKSDYRALLEGVDANTGTGQKQFATLLNLQDKFAAVSTLMGDQKLTLAELAKQAPTVAALDNLLTPSQTTAQATQNVADGVSTSNTLLGQIATKLDTISTASTAAAAAANAAATAAGNAASAAASAASSASLTAAAPTYSYDIGGGGG